MSTTVLAVGFISAELLSLHQSIGILMDAEVGATITAQITGRGALRQFSLISAPYSGSLSGWCRHSWT